MGEGAVRPIVEERKENGPYQSIDDFCRRAGVSGLNRRTLESVAKAGAFDSLAARGTVIGALDQIVATAQREARTRDSGQSSLFDGNDEAANAAGMSGIHLTAPDVSDQEKAAWERELLGMALSHNALRTLGAIDTGGALNSLDQLDDEMSGQAVNMLGYISTVMERSTREGKRFFIVNLEVLGGFMEVMVWPDTLQRTTEVWQEGRLVLVAGKLRLRGDQMSLACDSAVEYDLENPPQALPLVKANNGGNGHNGNGHKYDGNGHQGNGNGRKASNPNISEKKAQMSTGERIPAEPQKVVCLAVTESDDSSHDAHLLREVIGVLLEYPGRNRVNLDIRTGEKRVKMDLPVVSTGYCETLHSRLEELLGPDTVTVQQELGLGMEPPPQGSIEGSIEAPIGAPIKAPVNTLLESAPQHSPAPVTETPPEPISERAQDVSKPTTDTDDRRY